MNTFFQRSLLVFAVLFLSFNSIYAQVKIGNNPATINANSVLELEGNGKGVLLPRSTTAEITAMSNVPAGMLLFNTTDSALYLRRDTGWVVIPVSRQGINPTVQPALTPVYADFYALMPPDNPGPVYQGSAIDFPRNGPISGGINRVGSGTFNLQSPGTYQLMFEVSVTEPAQLAVVINDVPYTMVGRASGSSQVTGMCIITTTTPNSLIEIRNPWASPTALTITSLAGGALAVSAHLLITRLQ